MFFAPNTPSFPDRAETVTTSDSTTFNASAIVALVGGDIKVQPAGGGSPGAALDFLQEIKGMLPECTETALPGDDHQRSIND